MNSRSNPTAPVILAVLVAGLTSSALAQQVSPASWHDTKCARYKRAWSGAVARIGTKGLGRDFLDRHEAFLASDCTAKAAVCPRSPEELKLANIMVVLAMDAGTASTFPPFACHP